MATFVLHRQSAELDLHLVLKVDNIKENKTEHNTLTSLNESTFLCALLVTYKMCHQQKYMIDHTLKSILLTYGTYIDFSPISLSLESRKVGNRSFTQYFYFAEVDRGLNNVINK